MQRVRRADSELGLDAPAQAPDDDLVLWGALLERKNPRDELTLQFKQRAWRTQS